MTQNSTRKVAADIISPWNAARTAPVATTTWAGSPAPSPRRRATAWRRWPTPPRPPPDRGRADRDRRSSVSVPGRRQGGLSARAISGNPSSARPRTRLR